MPAPAKQPTQLKAWELALEKAPLFLSVMLLFSLPLLTRVEGQDPIFSKFAVAQIIVFLILAAWIFRVWWTGKLIWVSSRAHWVLIIFAIWALITALFSPYPKACFLQMNDWVLYPLWYFLLTATCLEVWKAENLLITFLISGLVTCFWAISQAFGVGEGGVAEIVKTQFGGRVIAGLGNPEALAAYLLLIWPLSLGLLMKAQKPITKFFWGLLFFTSLASLFFSGSAPGLVGFAFGAIIFSALTFRDQGIQAIKWVGILLVFVAVSFLIPPMATNFKNMWEGRNATVQFQEQVWKGTLKMVQERPVFGFGQGTFSAAFPSFRPASIMIHQPQLAYEIKHADNWLLEWTAETGVIGLILLLAFWFYILVQWWKLYAANAISKPLATGAFAAMGAIAMNGLLDQSNYFPSTLIPLLFLAAFPVALSQRFYRMEGFPIQVKEINLEKMKTYLLPVLVLFIALAFQKVGNSFQRQGADIEIKNASTTTQAGKWDDAVNGYLRALKLYPQNTLGLYSLGTAYLDRNQVGDLEKALAEFNAAGLIEPDFNLIHLKKYEVLNQLKQVEDAKTELKRAIQLDPMLIYLSKDFEKARTLASTRHFSVALIIYQNLYFDYPTCVPMLIDYANCFAMAGDYNSAFNLYQSVLELDPLNPKALHDLQIIQDVRNRARTPKSPKANILGSELE